MPDPWNTPQALSLHSGFTHGASHGQDSVLQGTFSMEQFTSGLQNARNEIARRTMRKENDEFTEDRASELALAELWLASAAMWVNYGSRVAISFPESNAQGMSDGTYSGPDTPSPAEKQRQYVDFMYQKLRRIGLDLIESKASRFSITVGTPPERVDPYPCLAPGVYASENVCNDCEVL